MPRLFESRITPAGRAAIEDLTYYVAQSQTQTMKAQGDKSIDAGKYQWMPTLLYFLSGEYEKSLSLAHGYVSQCEKIHGDNSREVAYGLFLQSLNYSALGKTEECAATNQRHESIRGQIGDTPIPELMMEALYDLAVIYQRQDDPRTVQRCFLTALATLRLLVIVYTKDRPADLMERLFQLFQSLGFPADGWKWLIRRCRLTYTDFFGLVSVLIDEGMFPPGIRGLDDVPKSDLDEGSVKNEYEIVSTVEGDWKLCGGFSPMFPISVADGELSMRVEQLLAEGCRYLSATGDLGSVSLAFSPHSTGRRITVCGTDTWSDEESATLKGTMRRVIAKNGADSAMILMWVDTGSDRPAEFQESSREAHTEEAVTVVARDAKSYLAGMQTVRRLDGKYVFEEPIVLDAEEGWFSEFTFPVQPQTKK
jgi:hypothetical protein